MRPKRTLLILAVVMVSLISAVPLFSDDAEAAPDISEVEFYFDIVSEGGVINIRSGESKQIQVIAYNKSIDNTYLVQLVGVYFTPDRGMDPAEEDTTLHELGPGERSVFIVNIVAGRYVGTISDISATFKFGVIYDDVVRGTDESLTKTIHIYSRLASENQYNKLFGIWDNPLPEPFDMAIYAAMITFAVLFLIAFLISFVVVPKVLTLTIFRKKTKENRKIVERKIKRPLFMIIILYSITVILPILGAGEIFIENVNILAMIIYTILVAEIGWKLYTAILDMWLKRSQNSEEGEDEEYDNFESLLPLFLMIGKIVIAMAVVAYILAVLGFNMVIIATGAGVIGLAISFGAQSTLAQFFAGFTLLISRPFRAGDLVRIENSPDTLRVIKVGFMMTTFRNWANSEIFTMPNQKVTSSLIVNITAESLSFRIIVLVRVPYGTDVALAKELALEAMNEHTRILKDGSEEVPKARLEDFSESSMTIRVSGFVDDFEDHRAIAGEIREAIYTKFRENNVVIAIPKMEVYVMDPNGGERKIE